MKILLDVIDTVGSYVGCAVGSVFFAPIWGVTEIVNKIHKYKHGHDMDELSYVAVGIMAGTAIYFPVWLIVAIIALPIQLVVFLWNKLFGVEKAPSETIDFEEAMKKAHDGIMKDRAEREERSKTIRAALPENERKLREKLISEDPELNTGKTLL